MRKLALIVRCEIEVEIPQRRGLQRVVSQQVSAGHAVEAGLPVDPGRQQLIGQRRQRDRQLPDGQATRDHANANSWFTAGRHRSIASSAMRSAPVSIASIARSFSIWKTFAVTP